MLKTIEVLNATEITSNANKIKVVTGDKVVYDGAPPAPLSTIFSALEWGSDFETFEAIAYGNAIESWTGEGLPQRIDVQSSGSDSGSSSVISLETDKLTYAAGETITAEATLTNGSSPLPNMLVVFRMGGNAKTEYTDSQGIATVTFTAPEVAETTTFTITAEVPSLGLSDYKNIVVSPAGNAVLFNFTIKDLDPATNFDVEVYTEKNLRSDVKVYEARNLTGAAFSFSFDFGSLDEVTFRIYLKVHELYAIANKTVLQDKDYLIRRTYKLSDAENGVISDEIELSAVGLVAGEAARRATLVALGGIGVFGFIALYFATMKKGRRRRR